MITIRDCVATDRAAWLGLWAQFLAFYDVDLPAQTTDFTWARLMDPASPMNARLAVLDGAVVGFAIYHHHCSTWVAGDDCYLEDLFVSDFARGKGAGRALIVDLQALARARGWKRLYWNTDEGNAVARKLYDSITPNDGHIRYRVTL